NVSPSLNLETGEKLFAPSALKAGKDARAPGIMLRVPGGRFRQGLRFRRGRDDVRPIAHGLVALDVAQAVLAHFGLARFDRRARVNEAVNLTKRSRRAINARRLLLRVSCWP